MVVDSTLTFAARRNVPVRYNRDLVASTLKAMQRVSEIRAKRERVFYRNRMAGNKEREKAANIKLVAENEHLLPRVRGSEKMVDVQLQVQEEEKTPAVRVEKEAAVISPPLGSAASRLQKNKKKKEGHKVKQRLLVGGGVENQMDLD